MDLRIGKLAGVCRKRSGAAGFMEKVAPVNRQVGVPLWGPPLRRTIAMPDSQIGWPGGQYRRKSGVAIMPERVALQLQEGVLKLDLEAYMTGFERWHSCVIFRCSGLVLWPRCARVQRWTW